MAGGLVRIGLVWAVGLAVLGGLGGCGGDHAENSAETAAPPRPLTQDEADQLSVLRFRTYQLGTMTGQVSAPPAGGELRLAVTVDLHRHVGYAELGGGPAGGTDDGATGALLVWNGTTVWSTPADGDAPVEQWGSAPLNLAVNLDRFLVMLLDLGADRPENPQLLRQSTARFLGTKTVEGRELREFSGPEPADGTQGGTADSLTRYWLDADGAFARFDAHLDGSDLSPYTLTLDAEQQRPDLPRIAKALTRRQATR